MCVLEGRKNRNKNTIFTSIYCRNIMTVPRRQARLFLVVPCHASWYLNNDNLKRLDSPGYVVHLLLTITDKPIFHIMYKAFNVYKQKQKHEPNNFPWIQVSLKLHSTSIVYASHPQFMYTLCYILYASALASSFGVGAALDSAV